MANQNEIISMALFKLAQATGIPTVVDTSANATIMRKLWTPCLRFVQADAPWPFLMREEAIALSVDPPPPGWRFRYSRPNNCLTAWAVTDESGLRGFRSLVQWCDPAWRSGVFGSMYDWEQVCGALETEIVTDVAGAHLIYTMELDDPLRFPPHFIEALATYLAYYGAGPVIGDLGLSNRSDLLQEYTFFKAQAAAHSFNQGRDTTEALTGALAARRG